MDSVVLSWLHGTITIELQDIIRNQADTARQAWLTLKDNSSGTRRLGHSTSTPSFTSSLRGALCGEYCRHMKGMANSLRDLGESVDNGTLVLNLLCGLIPRYSHLKAFPALHVVRTSFS
jgi:hypothetical protein